MIKSSILDPELTNLLHGTDNYPALSITCSHDNITMELKLKCFTALI
jgi:hypothetical protein